MKLKDSILQEIAAKAVKLLHEYEQYVDEDGWLHDDEGNKEFVGKGVASGTYGLHDSPLRGGGYSNPGRKTTYTGASANASMVKAVEMALASKPNNFLTSILSQLKAGRGLSGKQKNIVKRIIKKHDPAAAILFEGKARITIGQLRKIIYKELSRG